MAGSWRATGGTWSSTRPIRRFAPWAGCCWPSRTRSWRRCARGSLAAVGANAGLLTATVPEFAALPGAPPDAGDPLTAQRAAVAVLRAVASRKPPLVVFLDDLQWAGRTPPGFADLVLSEKPVEGLLLVGVYRERDVDAAHPLAVPPARWRDQATVRHLRVVNLPGPSLVTRVGEMLHVAPATAAPLAEAIEPHTRGNPYETVELLNVLRRDGVLTDLCLATLDLRPRRGDHHAGAGIGRFDRLGDRDGQPGPGQSPPACKPHRSRVEGPIAALEAGICTPRYLGGTTLSASSAAGW